MRSFSILIAILILAPFTPDAGAQARTTNTSPVTDQNLSGAGHGLSAAGSKDPSNSPSVAPGSKPAASSNGIPGATLSTAPGEYTPLPARPLVSDATNAQATVPDYAIYRFFFLNLELLEAAADRDQRNGKAQRSALWRTHEQRAANLSDTEAAMVKDLAFKCNQAVKDEDAKILAAIQTFRAQSGGDRSVAPPPELLALGDERKAIISTHIDQLRQALGQSSFQKLNNYVHDAFKPQVVAAPQVSASPAMQPGPASQKEQQ